jgi:glucose 1-dehydrogenase
MRTAATELLPHKIRVNAVYPGWTDTPGERKFMTDEALQQAATGLPWQRLATPEEIARAVVFLADPASDYITGTVLHVDGGLFLPWWSKRGADGKF